MIPFASVGAKEALMKSFDSIFLRNTTDFDFCLSNGKLILRGNVGLSLTIVCGALTANKSVK